MCNLLLDIGNTNLKWCISSENGLSPISSLAFGEVPVSSLMYIWKELSPDSVLVSNVAHSKINRQVDALCMELWSIHPIFVQTRVQAFGVLNGYDLPETLGVDRWMALIGARTVTQDAVCVVDVGTALTIDMLDTAGQHLGGFILPGFHMMQHCLTTSTQIQGIKPVDSYTPFLAGRSTAAAIQNGCFSAIQAFLERLCCENHTERMQLILTGGDAAIILPFIQSSSDQQVQHIPNLVFRGMSLLISDESMKTD